ncbi:hypothetical protein E2562_033531 [Oryza meyeriana var. granulata]|uniref:Uncharacterized protein n=1 Tax=Oryza meyeriana var. granulata TaxID=110450 RepID=A0A6G1CJJ4_9ORYZ|nr:hypothetical protein E2562_033531 [Oryza meyeriana var. granulata]
MTFTNGAGEEERMDLDWGTTYGDERHQAAATEEGAVARVERTRRMLDSLPLEWSGRQRPVGLNAGEQGRRQEDRRGRRMRQEDSPGGFAAGRRVRKREGCAGRGRRMRMPRATERRLSERERMQWATGWIQMRNRSLMKGD